MSDDSNLSGDAPAAPAPKKPPVALIVGGAAVVAALVGVLATRAPTPSPPSPMPPKFEPGPAGIDASVRAAPEPLADASVMDPGDDPGDVGPPLDGPSRSTLSTAPGAGADVLRIFAPLLPGSMLGAARIDRISVVIDGRIMVDLSVGASRGSLAVMLHSPAASQLVRAGPYVIYVHGPLTPELSAATPLLADALRQSGDAGAEVPAGLRPFARDVAPR
jgi:hypothetical protein